MSDSVDDYTVDDFNFDQDQPTDQPKRVAVWACPERPGPPLHRRDLVNGHHRNLSYGWTWWSARHIVALPAGMSFYDALCCTDPIEVTITHDVDALDSGLNELHERYPAEWSSRKPEQRLLDAGDLLAPIEKIDGDSFRLLRDIERRALGLSRAVVRSDNYGREPLYMLSYDWPDGTFVQGGTKNESVPATAEQEADPDAKVYHGRVLVRTGVFMEAFPRNPGTFLRGEGATYRDAEDALWTKWTRIIGCPSPTGTHEYETRGYRNGCGTCKHCGLFSSGVFDLAAIGSVCALCGVGTYWQMVPRRNADETWAHDETDLVCQDHALPSYLDAVEQHDRAADPEDHTEGDADAPDLTWIAHRLPVGVPAHLVSHSDFHEAFRHAVRDRLDALIAERDENPDTTT